MPRTPERPLVGVLERNRAAAAEVARALAAGTNGAEVVVADSPDGLLQRVDRTPALLALDERDLERGLAWLGTLWDATRLIVWSQESMEVAVAAARREPRVAALLGWPAYRSTPALDEVTLAARRSLGHAPGGVSVPDLLGWGGAVVRWQPRTRSELERTVEAVTGLGARLSLPGRVAARMGEAAHELLMNAMYDAPVDAHGRALHAHDRTADVRLSEAAAPTLVVGCDGAHVALQVTDPFGRLQRRTVLDAVARGLEQSSRTEGVALDTSNGGAGLGLVQLYGAAQRLLFDIVAGSRTRVTWMHDLRVAPRDLRRTPTSLHIYEATRPLGER